VTIRRLLASPHPVVWVFTGDNLAQGAVYTDGARGFVEHFAERVRSELRRVLDLVINTGISGDTARGLLKLYKFRSLRFRPDVVSLCVGMNDAKAGKSGRSAFRRDLRDLLDRTRTIGAVPVLHSPNAIDPQSVFNRADLPGYVQILREEAERFDVPLIDHYRHWKHLALPGDGWRGWLADGRIQPDGSGHRELARLLFHVFGIFDPRSPTCTGDA
jgi:lysophospholipase L1-like esterase